MGGRRPPDVARAVEGPGDGSPHDPATGAVIEPISLSTTFAQTAVGKPVGDYEYSRSSNPNRTNFENAVAALEHARYALAFSSGSATTANILQSLAAGSHVISVSDVYGGTHRYFTQVAKAHGVKVTFTPEIVAHVAGWLPLMVIGGALGIVAAALVAPVLARAGRMGMATAYFSLLPGGVIEMARIGESHGGDRTTIAALHAIRVALVVGRE